MFVLAAFALAGGLAQFIDGTLGMGFGVTSATILLFLGVSPVTASAATHAAKLPTTMVSGLAHWRAGNGDLPGLLRAAPPGAAPRRPPRAPRRRPEGHRAGALPGRQRGPAGAAPCRGTWSGRRLPRRG